MAGGRAGVADLRGPRLLNKAVKLSAADLKAALAREARDARLRLHRRRPIPMRSATPENIFANSSMPARMATWTGSRRSPNGAIDPRVLWPDVRSVIMLGVNYGPDEDPLAILATAHARRDLGLCAGRRLSRRHQEAAEGAGALAGRAASGGEVKVFVDTAAVMEKPLAQAAGLGWQGKHTNLVSREFGSWLFLGAIFTALDLPRDDADDRSLRHLPRLPRHLPDRGVSRALPARCAALHFLSHDRAQGADPARIPQSDRQPHLWLRRLPRGLPVEQVRAGRAAKRNSPRATNCARRRSPSSRGSTMPRSARCSRNRRSSASAATASSATC